MQWDQGHDSPDVEDRRGLGGGRSGAAGIGGLLFLVPYLMRSPWGWLILLAAGGYWAWSNFSGGGAPADDGQRAHGAQTTAPANKTEQEEVHFVSFVLDDTQATWTKNLAATPKPYRHAKLVLFTDATQTGCGYGQSATGPFYCPQDEHVYIDLGFFHELERRFGAPGKFAQAYVVAHEIGHHVQKVLGINAQNRAPSKGATGTSVRMELQADCFAGIWSRSTDQRHLLEAGDVDGALRAAAAIGDDRLQKQATGHVSPETWTHGSSAERQKWFRKGFDGGNVSDCDTFAATDLLEKSTLLAGPRAALRSGFSRGSSA